MKTTEPIRDKKQVVELIMYYFKRGQMRNYLLIMLCLHTALRISDVLKLTTDDVYDFKKKCIRSSITLTESKTGKTQTIALHEDLVNALLHFFTFEKLKTSTTPDKTDKKLKASASLDKTDKKLKVSPTPGIPLILNERTGKAISRVQAHRIVRDAGEAIGLKVSCHSLRKTFGYNAWKEGISPAVIMEIYNHSSLKITQRYLGINQDDINDVYLSMSFGLSIGLLSGKTLGNDTMCI